MQYYPAAKPQMSQVRREWAAVMQTSGMSTLAVAPELNVLVSTISHFNDLCCAFIHNSPGPSHSSSPPTSSEFSCCSNPMNFVPNCLKPSQRSLFTCSASSSGFQPDCSSLSWPTGSHSMVPGTLESSSLHGCISVLLYRPGGRQCHVGEQFADDGLLNAQRYRGETLRPVVVPFVHDQHLMPLVLQRFLEAKNTLVLAWLANSPTESACTTACSSSCQFPTTSFSCWRGVDLLKVSYF